VYAVIFFSSEIPSEVLDAPVKETSLPKVVEVIGDDYHFLMVELGASIQEIQCKTADYMHNMMGAIHSLLQDLTTRPDSNCSLRHLLSVMEFVGIRTDSTQKDILKSLLSKTR